MTVQNLYTQYLEGKITKQKFLYEVRRDQNLTMISPNNSFDDVVKILKNKSIISEKAHKESTGKQEVEIIAKTIDMVNPYEYTKGMEYELDIMDIPATSGDLSEENIAKAQKKVLTNLTKNPRYYTEKICGKGEVSEEWVEVTKKEMDKIGKGKSKIIREGVKDGLKQMGYSESDIEDFMDEYKQGGSKLPKKVKDYLDSKKGIKKEGIKNLIKKVLKEEDLERAERGTGNPYGTEEEYELFNSPEEGKSDAEYKNELKQYLQDNQIFGYTDYIHDLMTGPDPDEAYKDLAEFLEDEGIYGYTRAIEQIYADYPHHQHWMNQEDEDESLEEIGMFHDPVGYVKSEPKPEMYTKKFVRATDKKGVYVYDIFKNGKLVKTIEGGEGDANAWMNNAKREKDIFESAARLARLKNFGPKEGDVSARDIAQALIPLAANKGEIVQYFQSLSKAGHKFDTVDDYVEDFKNYVADKSLEENKDADLKIYKSELNMLNKIKPTGEKQLKRKEFLEKEIAKLEKGINEHGEYFDRVSDMNISQSPLEEKRLRIYEKYAQKMGKTVDEVKNMVDEAIALKDRAGNIQYAKDSTEASNIEKNAKSKGITLTKTAV